MSIATERAALFAQGLEIVKREDWGAACSYTSSRPVSVPASWLFLHVSVTARTSDEARGMRIIEDIGQSRFGIGCSYNAAVFPSGRLFEGQPLGRRGAHTVNDLPNPQFPEGSLNHDARALVLPQMDTDPVSDEQIDSAAKWAAACIRAGFVKPGARWFGHRDVTRKSCPGPAGYARLAELNSLTRRYETEGLDADMSAEAERKIDEIHALVKALVPRPPQRVATTGTNLGDLAADGTPAADLWRWGLEQLGRVRDLDAAEQARMVLAGLGDVVLSDAQVRSIIDAMPAAVKQALREGAG